MIAQLLTSLRRHGCITLFCVMTAACGSAPSAPTITLRPIALAGQSNAWLIRPTLEAAYRPGVVVGFSQDGSKIEQWRDGSEFWRTLALDLHQPLRAFVWWQGESDADRSDYVSAVVEFLSRVRREANDPALLIVVCRVIDSANFSSVRAAQEAYVRSDPRSVLVSSDGLSLESPTSAHLSPAGYEQMAQRILQVLP